MEAAYETLQFSQADGIARIVLSRPDRLNSFTAQMHEELADALKRLAVESARVLLLTGAGRGFCAGQDLNDPAVAPGRDIDLGDALRDRYNPLIRRLVSLDMPVVCAVNGVAAGAGANLALCADIVIAARSAKFIQSFANIGLVPDSGGTWVLPRLVGQARAMGLALTGLPLSAEQAADWGLIWKVVDDDQLTVETDRLLSQLAQAPTAGLAATRAALRGAFERSLEAQLELERDAQSELGRTDDYREGVAAFLAKRPPTFRGH